MGVLETPSKAMEKSLAFLITILLGIALVGATAEPEPWGTYIAGYSPVYKGYGYAGHGYTAPPVSHGYSSYWKRDADARRHGYGGYRGGYSSSYSRGGGHGYGYGRGHYGKRDADARRHGYGGYRGGYRGGYSGYSYGGYGGYAGHRGGYWG